MTPDVCLAVIRRRKRQIPLPLNMKTSSNCDHEYNSVSGTKSSCQKGMHALWPSNMHDPNQYGGTTSIYPPYFAIRTHRTFSFKSDCDGVACWKNLRQIVHLFGLAPWSVKPFENGRIRFGNGFGKKCRGGGGGEGDWNWKPNEIQSEINVKVMVYCFNNVGDQTGKGCPLTLANRRGDSVNSRSSSRLTRNWT